MASARLVDHVLPEGAGLVVLDPPAVDERELRGRSTALLVAGFVFASEDEGADGLPLRARGLAPPPREKGDLSVRKSPVLVLGQGGDDGVEQDGDARDLDGLVEGVEVLLEGERGGRERVGEREGRERGEEEREREREKIDVKKVSGEKKKRRKKK